MKNQHVAPINSFTTRFPDGHKERKHEKVRLNLSDLTPPRHDVIRRELLIAVGIAFLIAVSLVCGVIYTFF